MTNGVFEPEIEAIRLISETLDQRTKEEQARILAYVVARAFPKAERLEDFLYGLARAERGSR